jgi:hypothetical protein
MKTRYIPLALLCILGAFASQAQISLNGSSYSQDFDGIGDGLPAGWSVRTGASQTALGEAQSFITSISTWSLTTGNFRNVAAAEAPLISSSVNTAQAQSTDRAVGLRQTGSFGDGANSLPAFTCQFENTLGFGGFDLSFKLMQCDPGTDGRTVTWIVEYATGAAPNSWLTAPTIPALLTTTQGTWDMQNVSVDFGNSLNNLGASVWIRIRAAEPSSGSGSRPHTAIDDFELSYSTYVACEAPSSQAADITFNNVTDNSVSISWTNGDGDGRIVLMSTENVFTDPDDGSNPSANTLYSGGQQVIYNGNSAGPITVTGLTHSTEYWFRVYEFCEPDRVYQTSEATGNAAHVETDICIATPGTDVITSCEPITWIDGNTYSQNNNTATVTLTTNTGCDSLVTLDLTITVFEAGISLEETTLTASPNGADYQWIDCDNNGAPISGAIDQSFTPTSSGNYAVVVTLNTCSEESDCIEVTIDEDPSSTENWSQNTLSIFPNPSIDKTTLSGLTVGRIIEIMDAQGQVVLSQQVISETIELDTKAWSAGLYLIRLHGVNQGTQVEKLIVR